MQDILTRLPPGFRFCPTDEELIRYYLHHKVRGGLTVEAADMIKDYNLYGGEEPWEIFNKFKGHKEGDNIVLYFFTTLGKKTPNSTKRTRRTVGTNGGTWHGDSVDEVIYRLDNREFKGTRRRFRYQNKQQPDQHGCWILLQYGSESISENVVICKLKISDHGLKESRKRKSMDSSEVIQRNINRDAVINSGPTMAHQEPRQIIQNQEMLPLVGTVSIEDNGGCPATRETICSIQNMGPEAPAIVNIDPALRFQPQQANFIQEPKISEHRQMAFASFSDNQKVLQSEAVFDGYERSQNIVESFYEHPIISVEPESNIEPMKANENQQMALASYNGDEGVCLTGDNTGTFEIMGLEMCPTQDSFETAAENVNFETMTSANENQQMEPASYNGDEAVCPAGDKAVTPEDAAPVVSALPVMDAGLIEYLKNEINWFADIEALLMEEEDSHLDYQI